MPELELSAGTIDYQDTGGPGAVLELSAAVIWLTRSTQRSWEE